jgi:hypothetical protein
MHAIVQLPKKGQGKVMELRGASDTMRYMTINEFENKDVEMAYKKFAHDYDPQTVNNTISAMQAIGYTVVAPFINEQHVSACADIMSALDSVEENTGEPVDNNRAVAMCILALSHMKFLTDIVTAIRDRKITSSHEVSQLIRVMRKVSEPLK